MPSRSPCAGSSRPKTSSPVSSVSACDPWAKTPPNRLCHELQNQDTRGESPRMVADRLAACLGELAETGRDHVVITHKGVLRASLVLALGWDMLGKSPVRYEPELALIHGLELAGRLRFEAAVSLAVQQ